MLRSYGTYGWDYDLGGGGAASLDEHYDSEVDSDSEDSYLSDPDLDRRDQYALYRRYFVPAEKSKAAKRREEDAKELFAKLRPSVEGDFSRHETPQELLTPKQHLTCKGTRTGVF